MTIIYGIILFIEKGNEPNSAISLGQPNPLIFVKVLSKGLISYPVFLPLCPASLGLLWDLSEPTTMIKNYFIFGARREHRQRNPIAVIFNMINVLSLQMSNGPNLMD